jgi:energy-coupling factor transport system permease protein
MAVEFSRDITFGQYLDLRSQIHTLDPRTKIFATGALMLSIFFTRSFAGYAVLLAGAGLILIVSRVPLSYVLRGLRILAFTLSFFLVFQILFYRLPPDAQPLWRWGVLSLSWQGLLEALRLLVRVVLLYYLTSMLMFTTSMMDLADGFEIMLDPLKRLRIPVNELVMVMVIAIKFVPLLVGELERLIKAQTARGARFDQGGLIERARRLGPLLVPLFVNAFYRAEILTVAMNARCYRGGQGRTKRRVLTFRRADLLAFGLALLLAAVAVVVARMVVV